jgi:hypothetical protein
LLLSNVSSYANFGKGCLPIALGKDSQYLENDTAYGHLQRAIDVQSYVKNNQCDDRSPLFSVCINNGSTSKTPCDYITFKPGDIPIPLKAVSRHPELGMNSILGTVTLKAEYLGDANCTQNTDKALND